MLTSYLQALSSGPLASTFSTTLHGNPADTPLSPEGHWHLHQSLCSPCAQLGPWATYKHHNQDNPCWIAQLLAIIWHGYIPPFTSLPAKAFSFKSSPSLSLAPQSIAKEHEAMIAFGATQPATSPYISPVLNAIRDHEVRDAVARLSAYQVPLPPKPEANIDDLNRIISNNSHIPLLKPVKCRLCVDYSRQINPLLAHLPLRYVTVQDAISLITPGAFMAKIDLKSMFLQIPLHPHVRPYFAYLYNGKTWIPTRTLFGASPHPALANMLTGFVSNILSHHGIRNVIMTDDIFITAATALQLQQHLDKTLEILHLLGWIVNPNKITGPSQRIDFLGIIIDSSLSTLSIPHARIATYHDAVLRLLSSSHPTSHDVSKVAGRLEWIATVLNYARPLISSLYKHVCSRNVPVVLSPDTRHDLSWWLSTLQAFLLRTAPTAAWSHIWTTASPVPAIARSWSDASGDSTLGFGLVFHGSLHQGRWLRPLHWSAPYLELLPVRHLLDTYGPSLSDRVLVITTDSLSNAIALNKGASCSGVTGPILRRIFLAAAKHRVTIIGDWIPRRYNYFCDDVSKYIVQINVSS
jgi:hypothetical protein